MLLRLAVGLVFILLPMLELVLLIKIGQRIGVLATVALVLIMAIIGAMIVSRQSLGVVSRALEAVSEGRIPVEPVLDGLFLMIAGILLLTPGLITDVAALPLLIPPVRRAVARACMRWLLVRSRAYADAYDEETVVVRRGGRGGRAQGDRWRRRRNPGEGPVIDVEPQRTGTTSDDREIGPRR